MHTKPLINRLIDLDINLVLIKKCPPEVLTRMIYKKNKNHLSALNVANGESYSVCMPIDIVVDVHVARCIFLPPSSNEWIDKTLTWWKVNKMVKTSMK